jgi:predicted ester cyclase
VSGADIYKITESYLEALRSRGDFARFLSDSATTELPGSFHVTTVTGRESIEKFIRNFHEEAFDANISVRRVVADDTGSMAELVFDGVHTGEFAGIAATQAHASLPYCAAYDFSGAVISAIRVYLSLPDLVAQLEA